MARADTCVRPRAKLIFASQMHARMAQEGSSMGWNGLRISHFTLPRDLKPSLTLGLGTAWVQRELRSSICLTQLILIRVTEIGRLKALDAAATWGPQDQPISLWNRGLQPLSYCRPFSRGQVRVHIYCAYTLHSRVQLDTGDRDLSHSGNMRYPYMKETLSLTSVHVELWWEKRKWENIKFWIFLFYLWQASGQVGQCSFFSISYSLNSQRKGRKGSWKHIMVWKVLFENSHFHSDAVALPWNDHHLISSSVSCISGFHHMLLPFSKHSSMQIDNSAGDGGSLLGGREGSSGLQMSSREKQLAIFNLCLPLQTPPC